MKYSVAETIGRIAQLGYGGIELMADVPHAWPAAISDTEITAIRRHLDRHGLVISNVNAFMMNAVGDFWHPSWIEPDAAHRRLRVQHTIDAVTMAKKLGARCITTEPGGPLPDGVPREAALDTFVTGLTEALHHAEAQDVQLLVEPEPGLLIENTTEFRELAERIDSPALGLNFDIGHFFCVNEALPEAVVRMQGLTRHYHVEDIAANRVHEHLIPGHGAIDLPSVLRAINSTGYDGWITVELYPYLDDPDGAGKEARDFLESIAG
jgi:sugar phosphate isomerase/epimerase